MPVPFRVVAASLAALVALVSSPSLAEAQGQKFRLWGGAGFAALSNPEIDHGRSIVVGGGLGFRFNNNVSLEAGFSFARSNRSFTEDGIPVDQARTRPAFQFEANRLHYDATMLFHLGRRQPFHPFVFAGAGLVQRSEERSDIEFTLDPETGVVTDRSEELVLDETSSEVAGHFGAGFDLYFLHNLAARVEFRYWLPQTRERRTRMFLFGASYFF